MNQTEVVEEDKIQGMKDKFDDIVGELNIIMAVVRYENLFGRNNLCHCNSSKKFKKCHLPEHEEKEARITYLLSDLKQVGEDIKEAKKELKEENVRLQELNIENLNGISNSTATR